MPTDRAAGGLERVLVLRNPYHDYAVEFIELFQRRWGIRSVAWYTDPTGLRHEGWRYPVLRSASVAAS